RAELSRVPITCWDQQLGYSEACSDLRQLPQPHLPGGAIASLNRASVMRVTIAQPNSTVPDGERVTAVRHACIVSIASMLQSPSAWLRKCVAANEKRTRLDPRRRRCARLPRSRICLSHLLGTGE